MKLLDLVDQRNEGAALVVTTDDFSLSDYSDLGSEVFNLHLSLNGNLPHNNPGQAFDLANIVNSILPNGINGNAWAVNLFLTSLAIARAETLGSEKVYIPEGFFVGKNSESLYSNLNHLVNEGTDKDTKIIVEPYLCSGDQSGTSCQDFNPSKSLILASGGTDNTVAAAIQKQLNKQIGLLQVIYQQAPRNQEIWSVDRLKEDLSAEELKRVDLNILKQFGGSALLRDDMQLKDGNLSLEYVPFRNSVFVALGLILASSKGYSSIVLGAHSDDTMAPDGTRSYVEAFNSLLDCFNFNTPSLEAPLLYYGGKPELISLGLDLGINFGHTWSCHTFVSEDEVGYQAKACGTCGNCITRYSAFKEIHAVDPVKYKQEPRLRTNWAGKKENFDLIRRELGMFDGK